MKLRGKIAAALASLFLAKAAFAAKPLEPLKDGWFGDFNAEIGMGKDSTKKTMDFILYKTELDSKNTYVAGKIGSRIGYREDRTAAYVLGSLGIGNIKKIQSYPDYPQDGKTSVNVTDQTAEFGAGLEFFIPKTAFPANILRTDLIANNEKKTTEKNTVTDLINNPGSSDKTTDTSKNARIRISDLIDYILLEAELYSDLKIRWNAGLEIYPIKHITIGTGLNDSSDWFANLQYSIFSKNSMKTSFYAEARTNGQKDKPGIFAGMNMNGILSGIKFPSLTQF